MSVWCGYYGIDTVIVWMSLMIENRGVLRKRCWLCLWLISKSAPLLAMYCYSTVNAAHRVNVIVYPLLGVHGSKLRQYKLSRRNLRCPTIFECTTTAQSPLYRDTSLLLQVRSVNYGDVNSIWKYEHVTVPLYMRLTLSGQICHGHKGSSFGLKLNKKSFAVAI